MMRGKLLAAVLATGLVLVGTGSAASAREAGTSGHEQVKAATAWPGSIARVGEAPAGSDGRLIITYDPNTGQRNGRYTTPWEVFYPDLDLGVSPDRTWAAASTTNGLEIGKRSGTSFQTVRTITTDDLQPEDRDSTYPTSPHFIDDTHLMFAAEQVDDFGFRPLGGYLLDLSDPSSAPVRTTDGADYWDSAGRPVTTIGDLPVEGLSTVDGKAVTARVSGSTGELASAYISDGTVEHMFSAYYTCNQRLDAGSLLCMANLSKSAKEGHPPARGTVAVLRRSADGQSVTLTKLVGTLPAHSTPANPEYRQDVYLSPDRKTLLMVTTQGWYSANIDGSQVTYRYPHLGAVPVGDNEFLDGWGPRHFTPFYHGLN
ncbi:hypothetical protein [Actinocatenispora comari]|nr:hypothetical protein [Actinocatenispora comari]